MRRNKRFPAAARGAIAASLLLTLVMLSDAPARADDTIKRPGDHPSYSVEIEPHFLLGWSDFYGGTGWGVGARFGIPIVSNGFIPTINNNVAVSFGVDIVHYDGCWWNNFGNCSANYFDFPVTLQWNFFVAQHWSVFGEPGLFVYHGFLADCPGPGVTCNGRPSDTGVRPAFYVGGRYHFNNTTALTMRLGYPTFSLGFSFMP
jgi:hypothetical protein